jgi:hypothetical protein
MINIDSGAPSIPARRLSNFQSRRFIFDGIECSSIEGVLQAIKVADPVLQARICLLSGSEAKSAGQTPEAQQWLHSNELTWLGVKYPRDSRAYQHFLTRLYDIVYEQCPHFAEDLAQVEFQDICHTIGNSSQRETVLTETEFIGQLNRLRIRFAREQFALLGIAIKAVLGKEPDGATDGQLSLL